MRSRELIHRLIRELRSAVRPTRSAHEILVRAAERHEAEMQMRSEIERANLALGGRSSRFVR